MTTGPQGSGPANATQDVAHLGLFRPPILATRDPISPPAVGRYLAGLLPDATLLELDDDSHVFARERPDDVAHAVAAHLARS